jgi:hypothetical protein
VSGVLPPTPDAVQNVRFGRSGRLNDMIVLLAEVRDASRTALSARGREAAYEGVYREHADAIHRLCLAQLGDPAAAEDCAAETFANALSAYCRAELIPGSVRPRLFRIARNTSIDWIRRDRIRRRFLAGAHRQADPHASKASLKSALSFGPRSMPCIASPSAIANSSGFASPPA